MVQSSCGPVMEARKQRRLAWLESREQGDPMTEEEMQRHFNGEMVVFSINQ